MARHSDPAAADAAAYAAVLARLAHRFADRAGVLEVRGLDETSFGRLERDVLSRLRSAVDTGDAAVAGAVLSALGRAVVYERLALLEGTHAPEPATVGALSDPLQDEASDSDATMVTEPPELAPPTVVPGSVDLLDLMETLHSTGGGKLPSSS